MIALLATYAPMLAAAFVIGVVVGVRIYWRTGRSR